MPRKGRKNRKCRSPVSKEYVKSHDLFGHKIELDFNSEGNVHKTLFGGIFSILAIKIIMTLYVFLLFKKLITFGGDTQTSDSSLLSLSDDEHIRMNETGALLAFRMKNST